MNGRLLDLERAASRLEQKIATSALEEKQILDRLWERYELSHSDAQAQRIELESRAKANRRIGELKRDIAALGTPNIGAIEEFDRVNTRYTYLSGQRDDVETAKGEIEGVIEDLTREMTSIFALYFSILKVHPTPFCVMDEIEAALDDANVTRYARYMRRLAGKTQFIVITHRRGTMEEADVLYGVTMQEQGVSKILTINLNDMAKELKIE